MKDRFAELYRYFYEWAYFSTPQDRPWKGDRFESALDALAEEVGLSAEEMKQIYDAARKQRASSPSA